MECLSCLEDIKLSIQSCNSSRTHNVIYTLLHFFTWV